MNKPDLDFLIIAPTPFYANRGCHMRIRGEAEALQKKGRRVLIITYKEGGDVPELTTIRSPIGVGGFRGGVAATWKNIPAGIFLFGSTLYETVYRHPKIIYGHLFEGAAIGIVVKYLAILLSLFKYKPVLVLDAQDSLSKKMVSYGMLKRESFPLAIFRWLEKLILFFPDYTFTSSVQSADQFRKISPSSNPMSLPDGISIFLPKISEKYIRQYAGMVGKRKALKKISDFFSNTRYLLIEKWLKEEKVIILYTGSYSSAKGFPEFVKSCLPKLLKNNNLRFLFGGGDDADIPMLRKLIVNNSEIIISMGHLSPRKLLFFSLLGSIGLDCKPPITSESSGKILNYMAVGLPVACFAQKNNKLFLEKGGFYAKNYLEFQDNIVKLAKNPDLRQEAGNRNINRAWSKFTWDKTAEKILSVVDGKSKIPNLNPLK